MYFIFLSCYSKTVSLEVGGGWSMCIGPLNKCLCAQECGWIVIVDLLLKRDLGEWIKEWMDEWMIGWIDKLVDNRIKRRKMDRQMVLLGNASIKNNR